MNSFLTSALDGENDEFHAWVAVPPGARAPAAHLIEGWQVPRAGLDALEKRRMS
jgi:hypothetical protein